MGKYKRAPRRAMATFILGSIIVLVGFLVIILHELAGWFTLGQALLIMFCSIIVGAIFWFISRKLGMPI
jgi:hypothetical protein